MVGHLKRWRKTKWLTIADKIKRFSENELRIFFSFFFSFLFLLEWDLTANLSETKLKKRPKILHEVVICTWFFKCLT